MFWWEHVNTRKHVSEHNWLSGWVVLSILAHLAHLAQSYFSLIFSAVNTYNFDLTNMKKKVTENRNLVKRDQCFQLFSSRRQLQLLVKKLWLQRNCLIISIRGFQNYQNFKLSEKQTNPLKNFQFPAKGCSTHLGYGGYSAFVSLSIAGGCATHGTSLHEFGHSLGKNNINRLHSL